MAATDSFFHWLKARDLVWKLCYFWSLFFILSRLKTYFFSTFLVIKYHGLQIIKGNSQSVQNTNFAKYKILQWEVSVVFFNYLRNLMKTHEVTDFWRLLTESSWRVISPHFPQKVCPSKHVRISKRNEIHSVSSLKFGGIGP